MTTNEGDLDRTFRIILGLTLVALALAGWFSPWGWIGVVPLATGLVGFCPLYRLLGVNTCGVARTT